MRQAMQQGLTSRQPRQQVHRLGRQDRVEILGEPGQALAQGPRGPGGQPQGQTLQGRIDAGLAVLQVACARAAALAGRPLRFGRENGDDELIDALIRMRRVLSPAELDAARRTAAASEFAHRLVMAQTRPGRTEAALVGLFEGALRAHGRLTAYDTILTVRGEVLHNHSHPNTLQDGQRAIRMVRSKGHLR
jgi:Xaa-Pro aminopeptidase